MGTRIMATIFSVVGAHQEDPDRLLMIGDDGQHYQLELTLGTPTPVEATDEWQFDPVTPDLDELGDGGAQG
jgi:hypothetical protein